MGCGAMTYILSFIKIGSGIKKLIGGGIQRHKQFGECTSLLSFLINKESALKMLE
jgi:hypothetical protein